MKTEVLSSHQIERIITRIAYQTIEALGETQVLVLVGVLPRGIWVAKNIAESLNGISSIATTLHSLNTNEDNSFDCEGKTVLLVDDIVNSGNSMMHAAAAICKQNPERILTACLVDRMHRKFPIHIDFTGQSLATTLQEHLSLELEGSPQILLT